MRFSQLSHGRFFRLPVKFARLRGMGKAPFRKIGREAYEDARGEWYGVYDTSMSVTPAAKRKTNPRRSPSRRVNGSHSRNPQYTIKRGSRQVVIYSNSHRGPFESRLYVNNGETATLTHARHKTLEGARKWAAKTLDTHIARATPRMGPVRVSSNPHSFHDARVKLTRKGEVKIAIHNPSSAAAFLKVMGRRKNGAVTGNPWDREQFISRAKDLEHAGYVRLGLNYTKAQAQKIIKAQRAKGNNARLMPYPSKTGGTKYGVWVQY